jgi:hypothetical protein
VGIRTYDDLSILLGRSAHSESQKLGHFLHERLNAVR